MRSLWLAVLIAGCAGTPSADTRPGFVIETIDREFRFSAPLAATLYIDYRAVSYPAHTVEFRVVADGTPLVVTYAIDPRSQLALATRIYDGATIAPLLTLAADDHDLEVTAGAGGDTLAVRGYTRPGSAEVSGAAMAIAASLRPVLDAVLPARSELGPVPAFWQNIDQNDGGNGGIGHTSSNGKPLLDTWSAPVSLLGALFLQGPCLDPRAGYACPCMHVDAPAVGRLDTCDYAPPRLAASPVRH